MRNRRIRTVEYHPGWGWIARCPFSGLDLFEAGFVWRTRSVARDVVAERRRFGRDVEWEAKQRQPLSDSKAALGDASNGGCNRAGYRAMLAASLAYESERQLHRDSEIEVQRQHESAKQKKAGRIDDPATFAKQKEAKGWRTMDSAPKDEPIIVWSPMYGGKIFLAEWDNNRHAVRPRPYWSFSDERLWGTMAVREAQPIAWRPLPEPPSALLSAGGEG